MGWKGTQKSSSFPTEYFNIENIVNTLITVHKKKSSKSLHDSQIQID